MRLLAPFAALAMVGCTDSEVFLNPDDLDLPEAVGLGACGFENGDLAGFGHPGVDSVEPSDGGKVQIVEEGSDFSALIGEDDLWFHGRRALLLRSNDLGDVLSYGVVTTEPFVPQGLVFTVDQLSEVDRGIGLSLRVLDAATGDILEEHDMPIRTGGYIPELGPEHDDIAGYPEITRFDGELGSFVRDAFDLTRYGAENRSIQVELKQHTLIPENGFFTLLDNLCDGVPADPVGGV